MKQLLKNIEYAGLQYSPYILFVVIFVMFSMLSPRFFQIKSLENIITQASYIGIVAVGITIVLLTAGIDLSVGSNMYLSASVAGILMNSLGAPPLIGLLACLLTGLIFGLVHALLITRLGIIPFIATLGTMVAGRGLALLLTKSRAVAFPDSIIRIGSTRFFGIPLPILIFAAVVLIVHVFLKHTASGRQIYAVGHDIEAAKKAGIDTKKILSKAYITCGVLAALGGFISVVQLGIINAGFGQNDEFDAIAAAIIGGASLFGGVGHVFPGTALGAILIQMISTGLVFIRVNLYLQPILTGAIIFLAVWLDSQRNVRLAKMRQRTIRVEE